MHAEGKMPWAKMVVRSRPATAQVVGTHKVEIPWLQKPPLNEPLATEHGQNGLSQFWPPAAPLALFWAVPGLGPGGHGQVKGPKNDSEPSFYFPLRIVKVFTIERFWLITGCGAC